MSFSSLWQLVKHSTKPATKRGTRRSKRPHLLRNQRKPGFQPWLEVLEGRNLLSTLTVVNTNDSGPGSLRQAILDANLSTGGPGDIIAFAIPATDPNHVYYQNDGIAGQVSRAQITSTTASDDNLLVNPDPDWTHSWWQIQLASSLPPVTDLVFVDGYSQTGAAMSTVAQGDNAVLRIELQAGPTLLNNGLDLEGVHASGGTIRGLDIHGFNNSNIQIGSAVSGAVVEGNFIGTDVSGSLGLATPGADSNGVLVYGNGNLVGTNGDGVTDFAERNLISGNNNDDGVFFDGTNNVVAGNYIGTDASGTRALGNFIGVQIGGGRGAAASSRIGMRSSDVDAAAEGNLISGNPLFGVLVGGPQTLVDGNLIGTDATGNQPLGNGNDGVNLYRNGTGNNSVITANTIAFNGANGVGVPAGTGIAIEANSIHDNAGLGIDLNLDGVTANHVGIEAGPNNFQNYPVLTGALGGSTTQVSGTLNSLPNTAYTLDFYVNPSADPSGHGEGQYYLGSVHVTTDAAGNVSFSVPVSATSTLGEAVSATATDPNGNTSEFSADVNVTPAVSVDHASVTVNEGQTAANTGTFFDYDDAVAISASSGTVIQSGSPSGTWSWSLPTTDGPGDSRTVTISATNSDGDVRTKSFALTVNNLPPVVGAITAPVAPQPVNTTVSVSASFVDPGILDTHTAAWNWGDGTPTSAGVVTETGGSGSVTGSHQYTAAGVYTPTLIVTDKDGGAGQSSFQYIVIYDPTGGFVTGGGWINSPAGAYTPNPSLTGKANFGFDSRYKKGASVPTGNTQFNFSMGNLDFHSTSYDWLVVAGAKAQYKGSGQLNGAGNDAFMLTAIDGALPGGHGQDTFRIKIWDKNTGNMIYDNQMGASDTSDPTTVLGGGSIVIHSSNQLFAGTPVEAVNLAPLTAQQVQFVEEEAIRLWEATGADPASFKRVDVKIVDLPASGLGLTAADTIWIDKDAAGHGWYIGPTLADNSAFPAGPGSPAYGHVDLLTVVAHELGHILGYEDSGTTGLMAEYLGTGTRRLPTPIETGTQAGVPSLALPGAKSRLSSLSPHLRALSNAIPVAIPTTPGSRNVMDVLADTSSAAIVPVQPEQSLPRGDKKNARRIPVASGSPLKTYCKGASDAAFSGLEGSGTLVDWNTVAVK
jgi:hypothetical protein